MSTFNFKQEALRELIPIECWAIYSVAGEYHIERASVDSQGRMMDFRPLGLAAGRRLGKALVNDKEKTFSFKGNMSNVILVELENNSLKAMWHRPPQQWDFKYSPDIKIGNGLRWMPGLVFKVEDDSVSIWAYKANEFHGEHTSMYHVPIHNVYHDGRLCINLNGKWMNGDTWESWRDRIEAQVFNTKKSEIHFSGYKTKENDLTKLHRMLPDMKAFPEDWLISYKKI
jgi:hypothetical protein